jgi:tape measure domain-containing protein
MAESVARVKILAQIEGLEGFDRLKGAFKGLQQAIGPADAELEKARKQILAFGEAGARSQQVIKGQVDALKALQAQASIGGAVYRQLGKDVKALGGAYQEAASGVKQFTDAQLKSQIVGSKPSTFEKQIGALKRGLQELSVYSRQYTDALTEIQRRQIPFNAALGRQNVIAGAAAYAQGGKGGAALPELPNTTAGLNQRLSELNAEFVNLSRGGTDWIRVSREIANVQRRLNQEFSNPAVEAARRRLEQSRNTGSGFLAFSSGLEDRIAVQKSIARNQARQPGPLYDAPIGPPEPSALFRSIGGISNQIAANQLQLMGRSYEEVAQSIRRTSMASDGSVSSLQQQRAAWEQLRATISPLDKEYAQIEREARKAVSTIDSQIGRRQGGNRGGAAQIGQGAGALAASGIFGGPEGFLGSLGGSLIGAAVGGPAGFATGAFLGGSVGAYGGMGRQALGGFADYAAQLEKQRIALEGVAGSAAEYQRALQAAQSISNQFNVPIGETTQSMTQLSAAVIGAGGKVNDAELVFRNITTAIKATGGGAEQVQGALTAMAQIFSKGKVSAEELQGQLGERLPGAVTAFAEATGRTLPQLQKDLEQGTVGLNDVMKFVISLGDRYTETAKKIATSDADAGQRFQKTLADFRAAIGKELVPIGAELQNAFSDFLKSITPGVIEAAKGLAGAIKAIVENAGAIANLVKFAAQMGAISLAIKAFIALRPAVSAMFAIIQLGSTQTAIAAAMATPKVVALGAALRSLTVLGIITVGVNVIVKGLDQVRRVREELKSLREYNPNQTFAGATRETVQGAVGQARTDLSKFRDELKSLNAGSWKTMIPGATLFGAGPGDYQAQKKLLETRIARAQKTIDSLDPLKFPTELEVQRDQLKRLQQELTKFDDPAGKEGGADKAAEKAREDAERLAAEQQRLDEATARAQVEQARTVFNNQIELVKRRYDYEDERMRLQADIRAGALEGERAEVRRAANEFSARIDAIRRQLRETTLGVAVAERTAQFNAQMEAVTSQGLGSASGSGGGSVTGRYIQGGIGPRGANQYGPHFDIKRSDGGYYARNALDAYVQVNGRPLSSGVTVPGGEYGAPRSYGGHAGRDYAFGAGAALTLAGGAKWMGSTPGSFGDAAAFMTPDGKVYKIIHGKFEGGATNSAPTGVAAQSRRNVAAQGKLGSANAEVQQANALLDMSADQSKFLISREAIRYAQDQTQGLRNEARAMEDTNALLRERVKLEQEGMRPELIEARMNIEKIEMRRRDREAELNNLISENKDDPQKAAAYTLELELMNSALDRQVAAENARAQALTNSGVALANYIGQMKLQLAELTNIENYIISMAQTIESSLGTAIGSAVSNLVTGAQSIKQTLSDMFKSIGDAFIKMAADIIAKQLIIVALNSIARVFGGGGGGGLGGVSTAGVPSYALLSGGGFASGFSFANGGVMATGGPVPLNRYATGGVAKAPQLAMFGERGPEAYVPLPDGRSIPVKMKQRDDALNRYRPIGANGTVTEDGKMASAAAGDPGSAGGGPIDVRYTVERINNVEYVTADQFQQGMRQAALEGARQGERQTLRRLQQSPSTRRKVGV